LAEYRARFGKRCFKVNERVDGIRPRTDKHGVDQSPM
jgi:hypothetical protein